MADISQNISFKIYAGVLGAVSTIVAQRLVQAAWKAATGDTPPDPNDPDVPPTQAAIWALASGVGLGVTQLATNRFLGRRYESMFDEKQAKHSKTAIKI